MVSRSVNDLEMCVFDIHVRAVYCREPVVLQPLDDWENDDKPQIFGGIPCETRLICVCYRNWTLTWPVQFDTVCLEMVPSGND